MSAPRWAKALLRFLAPRHREDDVVGDLEETHGDRVERRGRLLAKLLTGIDTLDMGFTILRDRIRRRGPPPRQPSEASQEDLLTGIGISWLDFKLGFRMLIKFPGLTFVAGLAIAFAITLGAGTFEFATDFLFPKLPFEGGDRVVELRNRDLATGSPDPRALHDFVTWRDEMRTVEEIGAFQTFQRNLITERGTASPMIGAQLTATAFHIARTPPILGRPLSEADEMPGTANVVLIAYDVWQSQFGSDPNVVGQTVRLASEQTTIIGVMPEGFGWPRAHRLWTPLRLNVLDYERGESPAIQIVGKLAPGASLKEARAEIATIGLRTAADYPESHGQRQAEVRRYGTLAADLSGLLVATFFSLNVIAFLGLLLLVCGNVALLLFARTAARQSELVVRSALGASRGRIVAQLFTEALVLGGVSAIVGLLGAEIGLRWVVGIMSQFAEGLVGYWFGDHLSGTTITYALVFTIFGAVVSGVVPALKVTGRGVHAHLQRAAASGSGLEFGRLWTSIIVGQIAVTVAFVPVIIVVGVMAAHYKAKPYGFPAEQYLMAELTTGGAIGSLDELAPGIRGDRFSLEYVESYSEVKRRLLGESGVSSVTMAEQVPGAPHWWNNVEVEGATSPPNSRRGHVAMSVSVDLDFFRAMGTSIVAGRGFDSADDQPGQHVAIVNEDFVRVVLEDRNALGRRFQFDDRREDPNEPNRGARYEIVGVVKQIPMTIDAERDHFPGIYLPLGAGQTYPVRMAVRVGQDPTSFAPRLRELVAEVDPNLILKGVRPLDDSAWANELAFTAWFWVVLGMGTIGMLLATAGIYSIMSFTVSRRTREIGVRVALGADRRHIVWAILERALKQIMLGVLVGAVFIVIFLLNPEIGFEPDPVYFLIFAGYLSVMVMVCSVACIVPTRRALGIEPTEALRTEG